MKKIAMTASLLALMAAFCSSSDAGDKTPTIKQIMKKAHAKNSGLLTLVQTGLMSDSPKWADLKVSADAFAAVQSAAQERASQG